MKINRRKFKLIACSVLTRELSFVTMCSDNVIDIVYMQQGLHENPALLREELQRQIDLADQQGEYELILLAYGLCGDAAIGLTAGKTPLLIPQAHDCISLLLGSTDFYNSLMGICPGRLWCTYGWLERGMVVSKERYEKLYQEYCEKYGEDNAEYLMEIECGWQKDYRMATAICWPELPHMRICQSETRKIAEEYGWIYNEATGTPDWLQNLVNGEILRPDLLLVPPKHRIIRSYGKKNTVIEAVPCEGEQSH